MLYRFSFDQAEPFLLRAHFIKLQQNYSQMQRKYLLEKKNIIWAEGLGYT